MDNRAQTCCFTGHRHLPAGEEEAIWQRVQEHLIPLLEQGVRYFGVGGALGFDTLVAEKLLELRGKYPNSGDPGAAVPRLPKPLDSGPASPRCAD